MKVLDKRCSVFLLITILFGGFTKFETVLCITPQIAKPVQTEKITLGERVEINSKVLNENRRILVRLPEDYHRSKQKYPVLYLLDGEFFFQQAASAVQFLSELAYIRNQPIPQMITVAIVNVDRNRDYTPTFAPNQAGLEFPTSGKAEPFLEFLVSELFPYIESNYRTQPYRILSGWSLGGLFTITTYLEHPEHFSAYLAISPSLWWDKDLYVNKTKSYIEQRKMPEKKVTVTVGSLEGGGDIGRSVRDGFISLMKSEFGNDGHFKSVEIPEEGGHSYAPYKALYEGLKSIYSDWQMPNDLLDGGIQAIKSFYKELSNKYGYSIDVPESAYSNLANYVFNQVSTNAAVEISKLYIDAYPESSYARFLIGFFYYFSGDLISAKKCYRKAIELEKEIPTPDSERMVMYTINLQKVEKEINRKEGLKNE